MTALVRVTDVTKSFGTGALETQVLSGVSLEIRPGELSLLMGPSGSGKTTLLSILAGLSRPSTGSVELFGTSIERLAQPAVARIRREKLGFVFQAYNLFPALSALDNVAEILALKGMPRAKAREEGRRVLTAVGLGHRFDHLPAQLSGGQKQRVAVARALANDPPLILGDEVTSAIDWSTSLAILELLRAHVRPTAGVLLVTHDHRLERMADRVIELEEGRILRDVSLTHYADDAVEVRRP